MPNKTDLMILAEEMQKTCARSTKEYYLGQLDYFRDSRRHCSAGYEAGQDSSHDTDKKILISNLSIRLSGQNYSRESYLVKLRLVERGVEAFINTSDKERKGFCRTIQKKPSHRGAIIGFWGLFGTKGKANHAHV